MHFRAIWISDIYPGTAGCQVGHLLEFLKHTDPHDLYLVGDIIDGAVMNPSKHVAGESNDDANWRANM